MGARFAGREAAVQILFGLELVPKEPARAMHEFWARFDAHPEARPYAEECVQGVLAHKEQLDELIRGASEHWRLERMPVVDRSILRLGTWELLKQSSIATEIILNESVDLAKRFGAENSGPFVNGVLDRLARNLRPEGTVASREGHDPGPPRRKRSPRRKG